MYKWRKKAQEQSFFNCNLNCVFCQNYEISQLGNGKEITVERLAEIFWNSNKEMLKILIW